MAANPPTPPRDLMTQVLVSLGQLSTKIDNLTELHKAQDAKIEKKADAADMERRWSSQTWFNRIVATTAFGNMTALVVMLVKHLIGN